MKLSVPPSNNSDNTSNCSTGHSYDAPFDVESWSNSSSHDKNSLNNNAMRARSDPTTNTNTSNDTSTRNISVYPPYVCPQSLSRSQTTSADRSLPSVQNFTSPQVTSTDSSSSHQRLPYLSPAQKKLDDMTLTFPSPLSLMPIFQSVLQSTQPPLNSAQHNHNQPLRPPQPQPTNGPDGVNSNSDRASY